jgi:hypothetical protein
MINNIDTFLKWLFELLKEFSPAIYMVIGAIAAEYLRRKTSKTSKKKQAYSKLSELRFIIPSIVWNHQHSKIVFLFHRNQWAFAKNDHDKELHYSQMMQCNHEDVRFLETYQTKMGELYSTLATLETLIKFDSVGVILLNRVRSLRMNFVEEEPRQIKTLDEIDAWRRGMAHKLHQFITKEYDSLFYDLTHYVIKRI